MSSLVLTGDTSGQVTLSAPAVAGTTTLTLPATTGTVLNDATVGVCRAWVNFAGTSATPITPRSNYNISSVTKITTGQYTLNFNNALSDANYAAVVGGTYLDNNANSRVFGTTTQAFATSSLRIYTTDMSTGSGIDMAVVCVAIFR